MDRLPSRAMTASALLIVLALMPACRTEGSPTVSTSAVAEPASTSPQTSAPAAASTTAPSEPTSTPAETTLAPLDPPTFETLDGIATISDFSGLTDSGINRWMESVPGLEEIEITSTADDSTQPALWLAPDADQSRPLLVVLHSWSSDYVQHAGIPYAMWAQENGWAVIAPNFRGVNDDPEALGSDLAVQDVIDAIDFATAQDNVDANRVYAVGYSGGGMMSLLLAGRHPEKVTAVAAWGPPYDLVEFYRQSVGNGRHYAEDIRAGCGGDPTEDEAAEEQCLHRSPMTYLDAARDERVPVFIGQGLSDSLLSPRQGATAFNQLANPDHQINEGLLERIGQGSLPDDLMGSIGTETHFGDGDPEPVLARNSDAVWLVLFAADHEMVYGASARWFATDPS